MTTLLEMSLRVKLLYSLAAFVLQMTCMIHSSAEQKNVLLIVVDDLRPALGCYGDITAKTPNIDSLAREGILFTRAYCQQAVCNPSRHSMLTGMRPDTIKVWDLKQHFRDTHPNAVSLPQLFKQNGYTTQSIGKIYHGGGRAAKDTPSWSQPPILDVALESHYRYADPQNLAAIKGLKGPSSESIHSRDQAYVDGLVCDEAITFLRKHGIVDKNFFLAVGLRKPHLPFNAPKKYWDLYDREKIPLPVNPDFPLEAPELATRSWRELEGYSDIPSNGDLKIDKIKELRHGYYACVSYIDAQVGKLLDELERLRLKDNTIITVVGDHGFHLGEQGLWTKANNYELSARVPLIISDPDLPKKSITSSALVELVDIYPTLADLCQIKRPEKLEGLSLLPLFSNPIQPWKKAAFTQWPREIKASRHSSKGDIMGYSIRTQSYRYVEWKDNITNQIIAQELYDHRRDPRESQNIASDPNLKVTVEAHSQILEDGWQTCFPNLNPGDEEPNRPNVLFLSVDDMKDWIGCLNGYEGTVRTPNIDALASSGVLFEKAYCPSPKCAPSRAAVMTGLMPSSTGIYDNGHWWYPNLPGVVTIPAHFRNHGYHVVGAGKILHHTAGNHPPNQWDEFQPIRFRDDPWFRGSKLNYPWSEVEKNPPGFPFSGVLGLGHENDWGSIPRDEEEYDDHKSVDFAVSYLKKDHNKPFFLACGLFRPHLPWYVPKEYFDLYPLDKVQLPKVLEKDLDDIPSQGRKLAQARQKDYLTIKKNLKYRNAVQAYLASMSFADAQIGRVIQALKESPYAQNTIIVLWSDHGWHLGEKGHWHKSTLWEESTRVPFIISGPKIRTSRYRLPVSLIDIFPTLNDVCSLTQKTELDGVSLKPILDGDAGIIHRPVVIEYQYQNAAVRMKHHRLISYKDGGVELYDHSYDPHEWNNLAKSPQAKVLIDALKTYIKRDWEKPKPTKARFAFDPRSFTWVDKENGKVYFGR